MTRKEQLDEKNRAAIEQLNQHVYKLREFYDSVQIFVTKHESDSLGTLAVTSGAGHWNARVGQIGSWLSLAEIPQYDELPFTPPEVEGDAA
jgi:hypothetical protein